MKSVNQISSTLRLLDFMDGEVDGWGNAAGREVNQRLIDAVEARPATLIFRISLDGIRRIDVSFARESVVELARRYRGVKGFCLVDVASDDLVDNWRSAARDREQPITIWDSKQEASIAGPPATKPTEELLNLVLVRRELETPEAASALKKEVNNVSTRLKQLLDRGYILRQEVQAPSGWVVFRYMAIG